MTLITAVIRPERLQAVEDALAALGLAGLTVTEVRDYGDQKPHTFMYRGVEQVIDFAPRFELDVVVPDHLADQTVTSLITAARTGHIGDGHIYAVPMVTSYRIRTGELE